MTTPERHDELNLSTLDDLLLVIMAQKGYQLPWQELLDRYSTKVQRQVTRLAARQRLSGIALQDLQQNAIVWLDEAIRRYDTHPLDRGAGKGFASFVRQVIADRFRDQRKRLRRREKHRDHSPEAAQALDKATNEQRLHGRRSPPRADDPAIAAERDEFHALLQELAAHLGERERQLLEAVMSNRLAEFAQQQGVTLSTVRRWRAKLREKLRRPLRAWLEQ